MSMVENLVFFALPDLALICFPASKTLVSLPLFSLLQFSEVSGKTRIRGRGSGRHLSPEVSTIAVDQQGIRLLL